MSSHMLNNRGRTFTMSAYVLAGGFVLDVFAMGMAAHFQPVATTFEHMVDAFARIAVVAVSILGAKGAGEIIVDKLKKSPESST